MLMAKDSEFPVTQAVRVLRAEKVAFSPHLYDYLERGGTAHSAASLGVHEHTVIKTIVLEDEAKHPLICLQHGDLEVSTKSLARVRGCKTITLCSPEIALRHTGYMVGGTSPFGTRKPLPVYLERSICTTRKSAPWLIRCVANACRSVCGESASALIPADTACRLMMYQNACRVIGSPRAVRNRKSLRLGGLSQNARAPLRCCLIHVTAISPNGTSRSFEPLPRIFTTPSSKLT